MTKKIILAAVLSAADILCIFFFVVPQYSKAANAQAQSRAAYEQYQHKTAYYAGITQAVSQLAARKQAIENITHALPSGFSSSALAYFLQQKSSQTGIAIQSVAFAPPAAPEKNSKLQEMSFAIALSGNYTQVKRFLAALERSARLFEVESIDFLSVHPPSSASSYDLKMNVKTHYYQESS